MRSFRQGSLDGLCGVYAAINAVSLVIDIDPWSNLPSELFKQLTHGLGAAAILSAMHDGLDVDDLERALVLTFSWLSDVHGEELVVERPFAENPPNEVVDFVTQLQKLVNAPETGVIISFETPHISHWSVAQKLEPPCLILKDSSSLRQLKLADYGVNQGQSYFRTAETLVIRRQPFRWLRRVDSKELLRVSCPRGVDVQATLAAMDEIDRVGRTAFQRTHGLAASGQLFVARGTKLYDAALVERPTTPHTYSHSPRRGIFK